MSWVAAAIGGSAILGAVSSRSAANAQVGAANRATDLQSRMFEQTREDQKPWREAGTSALGEIANQSDFFNHRFNANDLNDNLAPNYAFMRDQGIGATTNMANAMGGLGGNSLAEIAKFTTGYAGNAYQQAFNNYRANQTDIFNRLASIAGLGQTAASNASTGGSTYAQGISNTVTGAGNARASGIVGGANAITGSVNSGLGWYTLNNMRNPAGNQASDGAEMDE